MTKLGGSSLSEDGSALRGFRTALREPEKVQQTVLRGILGRNANCVYGRRYRFDEIRDARQYRERVPPCTYDALRSSVQRMANGEAAVLTSEGPCAWEETSGSGGAKLIPYTHGGLSDFRAGLRPWLEALQSEVPAAFVGRSYWSISPAARPERYTADGHVIGMASDAAYFGEPHGSRLLSQLAVPAQAAGLRDMEAWRRYTLIHLVACEDLALVSVWSPMFFIELLRALVADQEWVAAAVRGDEGARASLSGLLLPTAAPARAERLKQVCRCPSPDWHDLWPRLALISCWNHARAQPYACELKELFSGAKLQGKGLLATEGLITLPIDLRSDPLVALHSGFYEFVDERGNACMAHEVELGSEYDVLMTTVSGLYRYAIGDRVRVTRRVEATPTLRFLGRAGVTSDICGEKLVDAFVASALTSTGLQFGMLAGRERPAGYDLIVDADEVSAQAADECASRFDSALCTNPQYAYARRLGQLARVSVRRVHDPVGTWLQCCVVRGQRLGDVKMPALYVGDDVRDIFGTGT